MPELQHAQGAQGLVHVTDGLRKARVLDGPVGRHGDGRAGKLRLEDGRAHPPARRHRVEELVDELLARLLQHEVLGLLDLVPHVVTRARSVRVLPVNAHDLPLQCRDRVCPRRGDVLDRLDQGDALVLGLLTQLLLAHERRLLGYQFHEIADVEPVGLLDGGVVHTGWRHRHSCDWQEWRGRRASAVQRGSLPRG